MTGHGSVTGVATEWISTQEAADILGYVGSSRAATVSILAKRGRIKSRKLPNKRILVTRQSVEKYMEERGPDKWPQRHILRLGGCVHKTVYTSGPRVGRCANCGHLVGWG